MTAYSGDMKGQEVQTEALRRRLLDQATEIIHRPDFSGYNADVNQLSLQDNALRGRVVGELLKNKNTLPAHLQDASTLDAHLLEGHLASQREALKAQQAVLKGSQEAKQQGWLSGALTKIKNGFSAVGSHLWRHKWKYLALAAVLGAGWYFSGYITPWLQQLRTAITQGAIDTGAAAGAEAAPIVTPALEGASEGILLNGQALHTLPYSAEVADTASRALIQEVSPPIITNGINTGNAALSAFPTK